MPRPVTIDLCAVVLSELVDIPDPIHILCSTHSDILKNVCHRAENILTAYMTDDNNPISALVSGLSQLNMNTFEQRMFNMILEGEVIFPVATNMHAAEDQMTRALHTCFYVGLLLRDHHIKLHSKNVGRVMRVSSAMPMRKEKDVVALGKHPHVPVVVYFQLTQTVMSCVILTDETTDLVLVQPSDSHADSGTVVLAAPLADTKISVTPKPVKPSARVINARDAVFTEQPGRQLTLGGCYYRPGLFTTSNAIQKLDLVLQFKDHATTFYVETKLAALQSQSRLNQVDEITELLGLCWEPTSSLLSTQ
ncbi:hypothetical protein H4R34_003029 [Dimargaris verticillata]|uniref:Uncharacterized protein n=1 Tax=Dimargaris verticillata TaxID=2761393 RepID=A0A9W8B1G7_9FUNG|nr:hypothetical protein H4R34_003029 [Dimargaris verticillata]